MTVRDLAAETRRAHRYADQVHEDGDPCETCGDSRHWFRVDDGSLVCDSCIQGRDEVALRMAGLARNPKILPGLAVRLGVITWAEFSHTHPGAPPPDKPFGHVNRRAVMARAYEQFGRTRAESGAYQYGGTAAARRRFASEQAFMAAMRAYGEETDDG